MSKTKTKPTFEWTEVGVDKDGFYSKTGNGPAVRPNLSGITPLEFKVLVRPVAVDTKTKGGILLPDETKERDQHATMEGTLIEASPLAFKYEEGAPVPPIGSTVIFARYSGVNVKGKDGLDYRLMNDKDVAAVRGSV